MLTWVELEEELTLAKRDAFIENEEAEQRSIIDEMVEDEDESPALRRRVANAFISLAVRLDPQAAEAHSASSKAA